jgi:hypothetical protein
MVYDILNNSEFFQEGEAFRTTLQLTVNKVITTVGIFFAFKIDFFATF